MKKNVCKNCSKVVSLLMSITLLGGVVGIRDFTISAKSNKEIKDYVIVAKNEKAYDKAMDEISDISISREAFYDDNNVILAGLTEEDAEKLSESSNLIIEEDCMLEDTNADSKEKVKVAVLDSGVDFVSGVELAGSVNFVDAENNIKVIYQDLTGHGTSIASIIAGNDDNVVRGVNSNVELYSVKVLDENNQAPISRIIQGIYWCIENDINIINMSFGTKAYSKALEKVVQDAYEANILMVAAAGNQESEVEYPAAFDEVMAVASTNTASEISDFSNTGDEVDIAAPGEKVRVLSFFGYNGVTHGTSIAVPHVVGVASLLWEKDLTKSNEFIRQLIVHSSKDISDTTDYGLIDASYAMDMYDEFDKNFVEKDFELKECIPENNEPVESFEEIDDDSSYVEGRWGSGYHDLSAQYGAKPNGIVDATLLAVLKAGAVYPDGDDSGITGGTTYHPEYHGGFKYSNGVAVNYVACYEFLTRIALKNGNATSFSNCNSIMGLNATTFNSIKGDFNGNGVGALSWNTIFSRIKVNGKAVSNTAQNRKYYTWGIAIHHLGDIFAHKTYRKSDRKMIVHTNATSNQILGADDPNVVTGRWEAAKLAITSSLECLVINDYGDYNEIEYALRKQPIKDNANLFLKKRMSKYVSDNGGAITKYVEGATY